MPFENSQILEISDTELDDFFKATPNSTASANEVILGKQIEGTQGGSGTLDGIEELEDDIEDTKTDEEKAKDVEDAAKLEEKEKADAALTEEQKATKKAEEDKAEADKLKAEEEAKSDEDNAEVIKEALSNTVKFLIKSGEWVDFEGSDKLEIDQEVYGDLAIKQNQHKVSQMFNELVDETGVYGKAIIQHIKNGGNPDEIIDLFKEQKQLDSIDTSTEVGKQSLIEKYYTDVLNWKPERIQKHIKRIIEDNEVDAEFTDVKDLYDKTNKAKLDEINEDLRAQETLNKTRQENFKINITDALQADTTIPEADKKLIAKSILEYNHKLDNGQKVNDFYVRFAQLQTDPKEYINLVRYVMNPKSFTKQLETKAQTVANANAFKFIKGNATTKVTKSPTISINENRQTTKGTDFSFALKK